MDKKDVHVVEELGKPVGEWWQKLQADYTSKGEFYVSAPLSSTPIPVYNWIVEHAKEFSGWDKTKFVLMDDMVEKRGEQYVYIPVTDPASYEKFAHDKFIDPLRGKINVELPIIKPELNKIDSFQTPINLLILALGLKGNYANIMPGIPIETGWYIEKLLPEYQAIHIQKEAAYSGAHFRDHGMSLGHQQALKADHIAVIISGVKKRELTKQLMEHTSFDPDFPLSIVYHPKIKNKPSIYITQGTL